MPMLMFMYLQMRQIDCAHDAGISATLAVELAEMVSPKTAWVCSPETGDAQQQQLDGGGADGADGGAADAAAAAAAETAPAARGGLVAVLEDRFPQDPSGGMSCVCVCVCVLVVFAVDALYCWNVTLFRLSVRV